MKAGARLLLKTHSGFDSVHYSRLLLGGFFFSGQGSRLIFISSIMLFLWSFAPGLFWFLSIGVKHFGREKALDVSLPEESDFHPGRTGAAAAVVTPAAVNHRRMCYANHLSLMWDQLTVCGAINTWGAFIYEMTRFSLRRSPLNSHIQSNLQLNNLCSRRAALLSCFWHQKATHGTESCSCKDCNYSLTINKTEEVEPRPHLDTTREARGNIFFFFFFQIQSCIWKYTY